MMGVVFCIALVFAALLVFTLQVAWSYDDGGDYGNGNDQRHCHESENCRGSFSPGPFDRSPVDVHDNCVSLDCSGYGGQPKKPPQQQPKSAPLPTPACLVPVPYHCDPAPNARLTGPRWTTCRCGHRHRW